MRANLLVATALTMMFAAGAARADEPGRDAPTRMNSPGLMTGGIVLAATGVTAIPIGSLLVLMGESTHAVCAGGFEGGCNSSPMSGATIAGGIVIAAGGAAILASIPMIVVGAKQSPVAVAAAGPNGSTGMTLRLSF